MTEIDISLAPEYATNLLNGTPPADVVITLSPLYDVEIDELGTTPSIELVLSNIFQGPKGDPGSSSSISLQIEQVASNGVNVFTVPVAFSGTRLFINGLRQSLNSYTISGFTVTLPASLNCIAGDVLTLEYLPS